MDPSHIQLKPGQDLDLAEIKLPLAVVETTVSAVSQGQVKAAEKQRVLGVVPNFYVAYDPCTVPLTTTLKFKLAARTATDVVSIGAGVHPEAIHQPVRDEGLSRRWPFALASPPLTRMASALRAEERVSSVAQG
ncbi:MAG TPA: hypothetical protein VHN81_07900 [Edaphobacter sp.]|nr:hypothetical protein [Edaphobacter sp.]